MHVSSLLSFVSLACLINTSPTPSDTTSSAQIHTIHQFPNPTWLENLYITSSSILTSSLFTASLYLLPLSNPNPVLLHNFAPANTGVLGITELSPSQIFVTAGNFNLATDDLGVGTYSIYRVALDTCTDANTTGHAVVSKVTSIPEGGLLNGLTTLSYSRNLLLTSDSTSGLIWLVDARTGMYSIFLDAPELKPAVADNQTIGVNGVHVVARDAQSRWVYFSNTSQKLFGRVAVAVGALQANGTVEILQRGIATDDFGVDGGRGLAYLAEGVTNTVWEVGVEEGGGVRVLVGGLSSRVVPSPTSVQVGKGGDVVFVSTAGGQEGAVEPGNFTEGGKVVAVWTGRGEARGEWWV